MKAVIHIVRNDLKARIAVLTVEGGQLEDVLEITNRLNTGEKPISALLMSLDLHEKEAGFTPSEYIARLSRPPSKGPDFDDDERTIECDPKAFILMPLDRQMRANKIKVGNVVVKDRYNEVSDDVKKYIKYIFVNKKPITFEEWDKSIKTPAKKAEIAKQLTTLSYQKMKIIEGYEVEQETTTHFKVNGVGLYPYGEVVNILSGEQSLPREADWKWTKFSDLNPDDKTAARDYLAKTDFKNVDYTLLWARYHQRAGHWSFKKIGDIHFEDLKEGEIFQFVEIDTTYPKGKWPAGDAKKLSGAMYRMKGKDELLHCISNPVVIRVRET